MNKVIQDAVNICRLVNGYSDPTDNYRIACVAKTGKSEVFNVERVGITAFGYLYDGVIELLEKKNVIVARNYGWCVGASYSNKENQLDMDYVTYKARKLGMIDEDQVFSRYAYVNDDAGVLDFGPDYYGTNTVIFFLPNVQQFINIFSNLTPKIKGNKLVYMGEEISISGEVQLQTLKYLLTRINSIVAKKELYGLDRKSMQFYERQKKRGSVIDIHNTLKNRFTELKKKIQSNRILKNKLVFVSEGGYGIFENKNSRTFSKSTK